MLILENVCTSIDGRSVLDGVNLTAAPGERLAVLGPSGSGKTSLLRTILGLDAMDAGRIAHRDRLLTQGTKIVVPPEQRGVSMVFEKSTLMPFLNVRENILVGRRPADVDSNQRLESILELLDLKSLLHRAGHALSGGEQQRTALARALFVAPEVLLLDEPFRNIDRRFRDTLIPGLCAYLESRKCAAVLVTHDRDEAFAFGQKTALLDRGRIPACDTPLSLYRQPPDVDAARLLGECNIVPADFARRLLGAAIDDQGDVCCMIRPEQLSVSNNAVCNATLVEARFRGFHSTLVLELEDGMTLLVKTLDALSFSVGGSYRVQLKPSERLHVLSAESSGKEAVRT